MVVSCNVMQWQIQAGREFTFACLVLASVFYVAHTHLLLDIVSYEIHNNFYAPFF